MIRILDLAVASVACDPDAASATLNRAARRCDGLRVAGMGVVNDRLLIFLEHGAADGRRHYCFEPLEDGPSARETAAEASARYYAGFSTVGWFEYGSGRWGLFARKAEEA